MSKPISSDVQNKERMILSRFLKFLSIMVICIVMLMMLEVLVRATLEPVDLYALTGREVTQDVMAEWAYIDAFSAYRPIPGQYSTRKTVNEHHFISTPPIKIEKPENTIRILFLGGSSTAGTGHNLGDQATWPWKVQDIPQKRFPNVNIEFINGALGGYTSFESYGRLWARLRFFSPDIIVVYHGWNEMYYFNKDAMDNIHNWKASPDRSWGFEAFSTVVYDPLPIDEVIQHSQVLTRIRLGLSEENIGEVTSGRRKPGDKLETDYDHRGLDVWRAHLRLFVDIARLLDTELYVAKQATLITPDLPQEDRGRAKVYLHGFDYDAHIDAYQQIYNVIDEEIDPNYVIDTTTISGKREYFHDHVHVLDNGATEIAYIVANALMQSETLSNLQTIDQ